MRTIHYELMRPEEFLAAKKENSIAYLPMGPLEWHGPQNPFGVDPLNAAAVAEAVALKLGGVVFPTLYFGTEKARDPVTVKRMGFENENEYVVGMDVPSNSVPSCYSPEEMFGVILRENLRLIMSLGFETVVMINGHGADGQLDTGRRLARELTNTTNTKVIFCFGFQKESEGDNKTGHANISETSIMAYLHPDCVRLDALPPREIPLKTSEWGIADSLLFQGKGNLEHMVEFDPRDATPQLGERYINAAVQHVIACILKERSL